MILCCIILKEYWVYQLIILLLQLAPWLAAEIPDLIEKGLVVHKETLQTPTNNNNETPAE